MLRDVSVCGPLSLSSCRALETASLHQGGQDPWGSSHPWLPAGWSRRYGFMLLLHGPTQNRVKISPTMSDPLSYGPRSDTVFKVSQSPAWKGFPSFGPQTIYRKLDIILWLELIVDITVLFLNPAKHPHILIPFLSPNNQFTNIIPHSLCQKNQRPCVYLVQKLSQPASKMAPGIPTSRCSWPSVVISHTIPGLVCVQAHTTEVIAGPTQMRL